MNIDTKEFERKIADYCNTNRAICFNSATAGMEMTLRLLGIKEGDEVITSAYTYTASASVINHVGAKIVLVDTGVDSYEMDYEKLEEAITEKTKAIIPVDLAGVMCDYDKIFEIIKAIFTMKKGIDFPYVWLIVSVLMLCAVTAYSVVKNKKPKAFYPHLRLNRISGLTVFIIFTGITVIFAYTGANPFVYFQF